MIIKTGEKRRWPGVLPKKDFNSISKYCLNTIFAKQCNKEMQNLCRTAGFDIMGETPRDINQTFLETIVAQA